MNTQIANTLSNKEISTSKLWWVIPAGIFAGIIPNVIFYYIVSRLLREPLLVPEQFPPPDAVPLLVGDVVLFSIIFALGAGMVFALVAHFSQRPIKTYLIISTTVLILSFALPLKAPTPPVTMPAKLTLLAMHVIGAIAVVGTMIGLARQKKRIYLR